MLGWAGIVLAVLVVCWCIGWCSCMPLMELLMNCFRCFGVCCRLCCYCCPFCRRSDPEELLDAQDLGVCVEPVPLPPGPAPGLMSGPSSPPAGWEDPMPKPARLKLDAKSYCGGLIDMEAPICKLAAKCLGKDGLAVKWLRAREFMKQKVTLFGPDGPSPMDIEQGKIGDCYFLSSCSALAEEPSRIRRIFLQEEVTEDGVYCVLLMKHGTWHEVWINDVFPVADGKAIMCGSKDTGKLWPLLLEKAWAVLYGGSDYLKVGDGGFPAFALHALSGCPTNQFDMRQHSREDLWEALQVLEVGGAAACAFCGKKPFGPHIMPPQCRNALINLRENLGGSRWTQLVWVLCTVMLQVLKSCVCLPLLACRLCELLQKKCVGDAGCSGIADGHAYTVLATTEVLGGCGVERLVKLRNPWGEGEWHGRYSDRSCSWTEEAAEQVDLEKADDGVFWMEFSDFEAFFACSAICYLSPGAEQGLAPLPPPRPVPPMRLGGTPVGWQTAGYLLDVAAAGLADGEVGGGRSEEAPRIGCRLSLPSACQAYVTVDEFREAPKDETLQSSDSDSADADARGKGSADDQSGGFAERAWCVLVFNRATGELVGQSKPGFRWMDLEWNAKHDGGAFSEVASLSTAEMELAAGDYAVVVAWSPSTKLDEIPKKVVCIVAASLPGAALTALGQPGTVCQAGALG